MRYTDPDGRNVLESAVSKAVEKIMNTFSKGITAGFLVGRFIKQIEISDRSFYHMEYKTKRDIGNWICLGLDFVSIFAPSGFDLIMSGTAYAAEGSGSDLLIWNEEVAADFIKGARAELQRIEALLNENSDDSEKKGFCNFLIHQKDLLEKEIKLNESYYSASDRFYENSNNVLGLSHPITAYSDPKNYQKNKFSHMGEVNTKKEINYEKEYEKWKNKYEIKE